MACSKKGEKIGSVDESRNNRIVGVSLSQWETFLKKKGIVYKDKKGLYIWNESHQPDVKMLREFRAYVSHINKELRANNDIKNNHKVVVSKPSPSKELGLIRRFFKWIY